MALPLCLVSELRVSERGARPAACDSSDLWFQCNATSVLVDGVPWAGRAL